jgi:hypothetical protein
MEFEAELAAAKRVAEFYGVNVARENRSVFLEFRTGQADPLVARLECTGYPQQPPDLVFLDPQTKAVSARKEHWPPNTSLIKRNGELRLCLPGTRWFERTHGNRGTRKDRSLARILEVLALCCAGQSRALTGGLRR